MFHVIELRTETLSPQAMGAKMKTLDCYFCDEQEEVNNLEQDDTWMFFCDDCQQWQCPTEECGCICSTTDADLFDELVDAGTSPQELVNSGLKNVKISVKELIQQHDSYRKFYLDSNRNYTDVISIRIYDEAKRRVENDN